MIPYRPNECLFGTIRLKDAEGLIRLQKRDGLRKRRMTIATDSNKPRPSFFLVGQMKCGTTALYEMLGQHPDIFMSTPKEPQYFAMDLRARFQHGGPLPTNLEQYLNLFVDAKAGQRCGDASALYLNSTVAARKIAAFDPAARIVAVVREPTALIRSLHLQMIQDHNEVEKDLRKALELEPLRRKGKRIPKSAYRPQQLFYSDHVRYVDLLARFHDAFPSDQVLILIYDDFKMDNASTVRQVLRFLGLQDNVMVEPTEANPSVMVRSHGTQKLLHAVSTGHNGTTRLLQRTIKRVTQASIRTQALQRAYDSTYAKPPPEDRKLTAELRQRFAPEVARLSECLGRDLVSLWGYDEQTI